MTNPTPADSQETDIPEHLARWRHARMMVLLTLTAMNEIEEEHGWTATTPGPGFPMGDPRPAASPKPLNPPALRADGTPFVIGEAHEDTPLGFTEETLTAWHAAHDRVKMAVGAIQQLEMSISGYLESGGYTMTRLAPWPAGVPRLPRPGPGQTFRLDQDKLGGPSDAPVTL